MTCRIGDGPLQQQKPMIQDNSPISWFGKTVTHSASNIALNLSKVAVPLVIVAALASIPEANAGPLAYEACCAVCMSTFGVAATIGTAGIIGPAPGLAGCLAACLPTFFAPTP